MVITSKKNRLVDIWAVHDNPYDRHTLNSSTERLEYITNWKVKNVDVDLGYRGHDYDGQAEVQIVNRLTIKKQKKYLIKLSMRRSAIEQIFGRKSADRLDKIYKTKSILGLMLVLI